jgi:hypothetical protein
MRSRAALAIEGDYGTDIVVTIARVSNFIAVYSSAVQVAQCVVK